MPSDETLVASAQNVLGLLKGVYGSHPGFRPGNLSSLDSLVRGVNGRH
jgi:hypothetical protein